MIPKIIHYCWFGKNPKSELIEKCIASWKKFCPDWEIIEWNEINYDVTSNAYIRDAYAAKKWAFVSDYVRLDVLQRMGGVYLDTDVEILQSGMMERYLAYQNVLSFENERRVASGLIYGTEKGSSLCAQFLRCYQEAYFSPEKPKTNTVMNHPILLERFPELKWNGETQIISDTYFIGCSEYATMMKHYGTRSWCDNLPEYSVRKPNRFITLLRTPKLFEMLEKSPSVLRIYEFLVYDLYDLGILYFIKLQINKRKNHVSDK